MSASYGVKLDKTVVKHASNILSKTIWTSLYLIFNLKYSEQRKTWRALFLILQVPFFLKAALKLFTCMQKENLALRITWAHVDVRPGLHWRLVAVLVWVEEALALVQDELHDLVLKDHVHGDVGRLRLRPKESRAEYDCNILHSHAIVLPVLNHPVRGKNERIMWRVVLFCSKTGLRWQKYRRSVLIQLLY